MRKQWAELTKMEFWDGVWGYEACISQIRRQTRAIRGDIHARLLNTGHNKRWQNNEKKINYDINVFVTVSRKHWNVQYF